MEIALLTGVASRRLLVTLLVAGAGCASAPSGASSSRAEVLRLARARSAALVAGDAKTLETILAEEFVYTNASGEVLDRPHYLARYVQSPDVKWRGQELDDVDVRLFGRTAVLTARAHDRAVFGSQELDAHFRSTFVFIETSSGWRCVAGHSSNDGQVPVAPIQETPLTIASAPRECAPADWSVRSLAPLLTPGKTASPSRSNRQGTRQSAFMSECTDAPSGPRNDSPRAVVIDGVEIHLVSATPAGSSGRKWAGNQCAFDIRLADGSGPTIRVGPDEVPPFTTVSALVRAGSAAWLSVGFNGYTAEFPKGGNRIIALDLCNGRVVWKSKDAMSNGGLLLLDDYLISPYGFTSERRFVFVLDSHSGAVIQKLPVVENVCPSKSWAPHWHPGDRCDAPGQSVGAATDPRIEGGVFLVDTNTGSASFQFQ